MKKKILTRKDIKKSLSRIDKKILKDDDLDQEESSNHLLEYSEDDLETLDLDSIESELNEDEEENEEEVEETPLKKRGPKADKEKYYVEPKKFDEEIMKYYDTGVLGNDLAEMVNKIAHKLSYAPNFINYTYREDMVGDALIRMFKALMSKKYDRVKGTNPFSYFTRIAFNAFRNRIKKEKHINETHLKYQAEFMSMSENYNSFAKNNRSSALKQHLNE
jgi:hypothetical protein